MKEQYFVIALMFSTGVFTGWYFTKDTNTLAVNLANAANNLVIDCERRTGKDCYLDAIAEVVE